MGFSAVAYGWILFLFGVAAISGALINSRLLNTFKGDKNILMGFGVSITMLIIMLGLATVPYFNIWVIVLPMLFVRAGNALIYPNNVANAMHEFPHMAGAAVAIQGSLVMLSGLLASTITAHLYFKTQLPLAITLLVEIGMAFSAFCFLYLMPKRFIDK